MAELPTISSRQVLARVGERSFRLGQQYARDGAIFDACREGMTVKGRCEGTSGGPYRVWVTFNAKGIEDADCSCPVGDGGLCKHVAALLLTWMAKPEDFTQIEPIDQSLEKRSKEELIALIRQMLRQQPDLESLLTVPLPGTTGKPANAETYRRQAEGVFRRSSGEWGEMAEIADELSAIVAIGEGFLAQQNHASAAAVYEGVASAVLKNDSLTFDEAGDLFGVIDDCVTGLGQCLQGLKEGDPGREDILRTLFETIRYDVDMLGGAGLAEEAPDLILEHATSQERQAVADWIRGALPKGKDWIDDYRRQVYGGLLMDMEEDKLDDEAFLRLCRETGRVYDRVDRLLTLKRVEDAIREAETAGDYDLLSLADLFVNHGHADVAEGLLLKRSRTSQDWRLGEWLQKFYTARKDWPAALQAAERIFRQQPSITLYEHIKTLAGKVKQWEQWQRELLKILKSEKHADLLIQVHLKEGRIDEAIDTLKSAPKTWWGGSMELTVAAAAEKTRPKAAREIYQKRVDGLINQRGRESYREACKLLKKVRELYKRENAGADWNKYVGALREKNRSLRALMEEMQRAKL